MLTFLCWLLASSIGLFYRTEGWVACPNPASEVLYAKELEDGLSDTQFLDKTAELECEFDCIL